MNDSPEYGLDQILTLYERYRQPLGDAAFDALRIRKEWKQAKCFIKSHFLSLGSLSDVTAATVWQKMITSRKAEYPNICKLVALVICLSGSNSAVEHSFSVMKMILSDLHLSMQHRTVRDIMMINCNDRNWSVEEKEEFLNNAVTGVPYQKVNNSCAMHK